MKTVIALLRGINVGGNKSVKMEELRTFCESLGLTNVRTLLQSGNVVFQCKTDRGVAAKMEERLDAKVILRKPEELRAAIEANPFPEEAKKDPGHLVIVFLSDEPDKSAQNALTDGYKGPEPMRFNGRDLYIYYGEGQGTSKLTNALIERKLGVSGTARNWNTVTKLLALAESLP